MSTNGDVSKKAVCHSPPWIVRGAWVPLKAGRRVGVGQFAGSCNLIRACARYNGTTD